MVFAMLTMLEGMEAVPRAGNGAWRSSSSTSTVASWLGNDEDLGMRILTSTVGFFWVAKLAVSISKGSFG